jgi:hypothetical protein
MKLSHFALFSLVDKVASFSVVCIIELFDQVLVLFSQCKYKAIYRPLLRAYYFCHFLFRIYRKQYSLESCISVGNEFSYQYWSMWAVWSMVPSIKNEVSITVLASVELLTRVQAFKCAAFKQKNEFIVYDLIREECGCIFHSSLNSPAVCFCHGLVKYTFLRRWYWENSRRNFANSESSWFHSVKLKIWTLTKQLIRDSAGNSTGPSQGGASVTSFMWEDMSTYVGRMEWFIGHFGSQNEAKNLTDCVDAFKMFFTEEVIE